MYVCVYVCVCMYVCMYVPLCPALNTFNCVSFYFVIRMYVYVCTYVCLNVCMYVCLYVCMYVCVYLFIYLVVVSVSKLTLYGRQLLIYSCGKLLREMY